MKPKCIHQNVHMKKERNGIIADVAEMVVCGRVYVCIIVLSLNLHCGRGFVGGSLESIKT